MFHVVTEHEITSWNTATFNPVLSLCKERLVNTFFFICEISHLGMDERQDFSKVYMALSLLKSASNNAFKRRAI